MKPSSNLRSLLKSIDHKSYPAYKSTQGEYNFQKYILGIDHVQGDPFASPSRLNVQINGKNAGFPKEYYDTSYKRIALQDHLTRLFGKFLEKFSFKAKGSGKSGLISISRCGQEVLERTACEICPDNGNITMHFNVGFPANGRSINSRELDKIYFNSCRIVWNPPFFTKVSMQKSWNKLFFSQKISNFIRKQLPVLGLVAFVADGAVLPRQSGISQRPLKSAVPFTSPESFRITLNLPHHGPITGMGIPKGITLIVGGGYHGKSTLLKSLELGVYNHITGDGREYVITDASAVKIRAEDGRSIKNTDISMFINNLPNGKDTRSFSTEDASGSTSQAANVIEAVEAGTTLFLIDEDTSATNFMIRDELMQRVVHRKNEPITPFIERVRTLYEENNISSIIVAGSSGSYFHVADYILQMDQYVPKDITTFAKEEAKAFPAVSLPNETFMEPDFQRSFTCNQELKRNRRIKMKTLGKDAFSLNKETVDLRYLEQLADAEQTTALGYALLYAQLHLMDGKKNVRQIVKELFDLMEKKGLSAILDSKYVKTNLAMPRKQEIFGCLNRYRKL